MVGQSPAILRLRREIEKAARSDEPLLITGETGTGKALVARAIHAQSGRGDRPFVAIDDAALLESARDGTLFVREIGDLSPDAQGLLLRFVQHNPAVRIIAATHLDLDRAIRRRGLRADLYYRLNVLRIRTPSLREHPEDIEALALACLRACAHSPATPRPGFSSDALAAMKAYDWPGNVRELLNRVRRAHVMGEGGWITPAELGFESQPDDLPLPLGNARERVERARVLAALQHSDWDPRRAAALLAVSRPTLYRLLKRHGLQRPSAAAAAVAAASHPATPSPRATEGGDVPGDTSRFD